MPNQPPIPAPRRSKEAVSPAPPIPQVIESSPVNGNGPKARKKKLAPAPPHFNGAKPKIKKRVQRSNSNLSLASSALANSTLLRSESNLYRPPSSLSMASTRSRKKRKAPPPPKLPVSPIKEVKTPVHLSLEPEQDHMEGSRYIPSPASRNNSVSGFSSPSVSSRTYEEIDDNCRDETIDYQENLPNDSPRKSASPDMKSADDAAENMDHDAAVEDDSRRLDNSSSVDSSTYKTAKDESFANQNDPDLAVSPQDGMNGTPSSMATRASSDDAFYDAMDDDFIQVTIEERLSTPATPSNTQKQFTIESQTLLAQSSLDIGKTDNNYSNYSSPTPDNNLDNKIIDSNQNTLQRKDKKKKKKKEKSMDEMTPDEIAKKLRKEQRKAEKRRKKAEEERIEGGGAATLSDKHDNELRHEENNNNKNHMLHKNFSSKDDFEISEDCVNNLSGACGASDTPPLPTQEAFNPGVGLGQPSSGIHTHNNINNTGTNNARRSDGKTAEDEYDYASVRKVVDKREEINKRMMMDNNSDDNDNIDDSKNSEESQRQTEGYVVNERYELYSEAKNERVYVETSISETLHKTQYGSRSVTPNIETARQQQHEEDEKYLNSDNPISRALDESFVKMNLEDLSDQHGMETTEADKDEFTTARNTEDNASGQGVDDSGVVTRGQEHQPQPGDSNLPTNLRYQQSDASIKSPSPDSESCSTPTTSITNEEEMNNDIDETVAPITTLVDHNHNKDNENNQDEKIEPLKQHTLGRVLFSMASYNERKPVTDVKPMPLEDKEDISRVINQNLAAKQEIIKREERKNSFRKENAPEPPKIAEKPLYKIPKVKTTLQQFIPRPIESTYEDNNTKTAVTHSVNEASEEANKPGINPNHPLFKSRIIEEFESRRSNIIETTTSGDTTHTKNDNNNENKEAQERGNHVNPTTRKTGEEVSEGGGGGGTILTVARGATHHDDALPIHNNNTHQSYPDKDHIHTLKSSATSAHNNNNSSEVGDDSLYVSVDNSSVAGEESDNMLGVITGRDSRVSKDSSNGYQHQRVFHHNEKILGPNSLSSMVSERRKLLEESHYDSPRSLMSNSSYSDVDSSPSLSLVYGAGTAVHNASKYRYPHELPYRPGHEAVTNLVTPPSVSMGVWGDSPRHGGGGKLKDDRDSGMVNGGGNIFGEVKLRRVSLDKNMNSNVNNNGGYGADKVKAHRNSWHPTNNQPQAYMNWQKPEVAVKPIEIVYKNGKHREVMENPSIAVVNASRSKSGGHNGPTFNGHHPVLSAHASSGGGGSGQPRHREASRSRSSGDGREMDPPGSSFYHEEISRKRSEGDGASADGSTNRMRTSYIETSAGAGYNKSDYRQVDGWRGGERRWREVLTRDMEHMEKSRVDRRRSEDIRKTSADKEIIESGSTSSKGAGDNSSSSDDTGYISHNSLVELRRTQLEIGTAVTTTATKATAPQPPVTVQQTSVAAAPAERWDYNTALNKFRLEKERRDEEKKKPMIEPLLRQHGGYVDEKDEDDGEPPARPPPPIKFYFGMEGDGGLNEPEVPAKLTAVGKVKANEALAQPFRKPREIEMSNKNEKFKRPSLSTATFTPINQQQINNNNNLRKSSGYLSSSTNSTNSIIEVSTAKPFIKTPTTVVAASTGSDNNNIKSFKSGITTVSGDNNKDNYNYNVSKITVNDDNDKIVIDTKSSANNVVVTSSAARPSLITGGRTAGADFGARVEKKRRSASIPPKEVPQSEINKAFTDQLMLAKAKLKKQASNSAMNINSEDQEDPDAGSPPPPPAPVPPPVKKEASPSPSLPDVPIPPPAPFLNKPNVRHLPPPPTDPREDLLLAIRRAGGVAGLKKTRT